MGWWEDLSNTVSNVVDTAADVVQAVVGTAGDVVTDVVETAGNIASDGLQASGFPVAAWLGGVINGTTNLIGAEIKLVFGIVSGVAGGVIRIAGGLLCWNGKLVFKGMLDIATGFVGGVGYFLGTLISLFQKVWLLQGKERPLTKAEKDRLRRVFQNSISLHNIRVVEGSSCILGNESFATTIGNTIYTRSINLDDPRNDSVLVHECTHVWQYQNLGSRYVADALGAQLLLPNKNGRRGVAYNWEVTEVNRGNTDWNEFNKEGQAQFIQDVWNKGALSANGSTTKGEGSFYDLQTTQQLFSDATAEFIFKGSEDAKYPSPANSDIPVDYTDIATKAVESLRGRVNLRWSKAL